MRLPAALAGDHEAAVTLVRRYLRPDPHLAGAVAYTGSRLEGWDGGGDRDGVAHRFTDADITAVALLSVEIPPRAVIELLSRRRDELTKLLSEIPCDVTLAEANAADIGPGSAAWRLWDALLRVDEVGWVTAGKLLARKRPRLVPIYDHVVRSVVGAPDNFWEELRQALQADGASLAERLQIVAATAKAPHLTPLRVFDIVAWMEGTQAAAA
jgi:hypothetical protein